MARNISSRELEAASLKRDRELVLDCWYEMDPHSYRLRHRDSGGNGIRMLASLAVDNVNGYRKIIRAARDKAMKRGWAPKSTRLYNAARR